MPEAQVSNVKAHQINNDLRDEYKASIAQYKDALEWGAEELEEPKWPEGHLYIFPRAFTVGTEVKAYSTLSVDRGDYDDAQEPEPRDYVDQWDMNRIPDDADWKHLVTQKLASGPVHVAVRGKCLVFTAGYHALVCHLGLEGNITSMSRTDFLLLVPPWRCIPGSNDDRAKAEQMRSFLLADKFIDPVWKERLWEGFAGGPDWFFECEDALEYLDEWRRKVLQAGKKKKIAIVDVLNNAHGPGGGIGKHLASDLLYEVAIHPDTPSFVLCSDNVLYMRFRTNVPHFMARWTSPEFLKACGGRPNSLNPFAFNRTSDRNFIWSYVSVYRRTSVRVPRAIYNLYLQNGLFDPDHIIGTPYLKEFTPITTQWKEVPVRCFEASNGARYHIILAQVPRGWPVRVENTAFNDISNAGFATTLGAASFREQVNNKTDLEQAKALIHRGHPPKNRTGLPGRPRTPMTLKKLKAITNESKGKSRKKKMAVEDKENEEVLGSVTADSITICCPLFPSSPSSNNKTKVAKLTKPVFYTRLLDLHRSNLFAICSLLWTRSGRRSSCPRRGSKTILCGLEVMARFPGGPGGGAGARTSCPTCSATRSACSSEEEKQRLVVARRFSRGAAARGRVQMSLGMGRGSPEVAMVAFGPKTPIPGKYGSPELEYFHAPQRARQTSRWKEVKKISDTKIFREVNTLSRLSHRSIVRYFTTLVKATEAVPASTSDDDLDESSGTEDGFGMLKEKEETLHANVPYNSTRRQRESCAA
ncbi:hypothetical protein C8R46DRAFT_1306347 [Mycena filopes]|nr:hypothetical protein C8R46DRAFT_1306347 [Mycena filopes]